jgi:hypothetical protein
MVGVALWHGSCCMAFVELRSARCHRLGGAGSLSKGKLGACCRS